MKTRRKFLPISSAGLLALCLILPRLAAGEGPLFYPADNFTAEAEEIGIVGAARYRAVFVEPRWLGEISPDGGLKFASEITLNLFEDTTVRASLQRAYPAPAGGWVWEGQLSPPHSGTAVIAFNERTLAATIEVDGRIFQVRNDGEPLHLVRELAVGDVAILKAAPNARELDVYNRTNQERQSRGIYLFAWNDLLGNSARSHSQAMGEKNFFDHDNPYTGSTPSSRMTAAGYTWNSCAENIAGGNSTAAATMVQWMNSSGHRDNILNQARCDLGVGYAYVAGSTYGYYWTQNFGRRMGVTDCPYVPPPGPTPLPGPTPPPTTTTGAPLQLFAGDFNGDQVSDIAVFRSSAGLWSVRGVTRAYFGRSGDIPAPADYNGNGTANIAIFRPSSGLWSVRGLTRFYFGRSGDVPLPMNYREGYVTAGIFRASSGLWSFRGGNRFYFGRSGDIPVIGPWTTRSGSWGAPRIAIFRPSSGLWSIRGVSRFYFGRSGDIPVPGDYQSSSAVSTRPWRAVIFRPSAGLWSIRGITRAYFGRTGDYAVPADYAGGWGDEIAIFRPSSGLWSIRGGNRYYFGRSGDLPATR